MQILILDKSKPTIDYKPIITNQLTIVFKKSIFTSLFLFVMFPSLVQLCGWTYIIWCVCRTILAVAGDDFAVVASDTRLSEGFMIHSRDVPKTYRL